MTSYLIWLIYMQFKIYVYCNYAIIDIGITTWLKWHHFSQNTVVSAWFRHLVTSTSHISTKTEFFGVLSVSGQWGSNTLTFSSINFFPMGITTRIFMARNTNSQQKVLCHDKNIKVSMAEKALNEEWGKCSSNFARVILKYSTLLSMKFQIWGQNIQFSTLPSILKIFTNLHSSFLTYLLSFASLSQ